jgi:flagellar biosynthesis protein
MTKKSKYSAAVALEYQENGKTAPMVAFKGDNLMADEIVAIAKKYNIPVVEEPEIVDSLHKVEVDQEIPQSLFEAVAVLFHELKAAAEKRLNDVLSWKRR